MVPNGWERIKLKDIGNCLNGLTYSPKDVVENGLLVLRSSNIQNSNLSFLDNVYVNIEVPEESRTRFGDIILCVRNGSKSLIGKSAFIGKSSEGLTHGAFMSSFRSNDTPEYTFQLFQSPLFFKQVNQNLGATINSINNGNLYNFNFPYPPIEERKKIATILGTWDNAISTTERLIDNSKQQKKALMQQLLTGKKRKSNLPPSEFSARSGFAKSKLGELPNDWNVTLISDYFWYQEGPGVRKHQFTDKGVKLFNGTNIQKSRINLNNTKTCISEEEAHGAYKHFLADAGDLVIACSGISVDKFDEKISFLSEDHLPLCMNTSTMRFKVKKDDRASLSFFCYFMMSPLFKNQIRRQITGSAQLNFGPSHVGKCFIALPSLEEQEYISSVLVNADKEIDLLEQQLSDLKQEKKALMQQLLTGKRRVTV